MHISKSTSIFSLLLSLTLFSNTSFALPDFTASYSGTHTLFDSQCNDPSDNGSFTGTAQAIVTQQGNNLTGTFTNGFGTSSLSGTIDSSGSFSVIATTSDGGTAASTGTISETQLIFSSNTITPGSDGCDTNASGTLSVTSFIPVIAPVIPPDPGLEEEPAVIDATEAQVQQSRQIVRATNGIVSQHLTAEVSKAFSYSPGFNKPNGLAASSDNQHSDLAVWGTTSIAEIHEDGLKINFDTDIYQFVGGLDKSFGDYFLGSAFTYAYTETEQDNQDSFSHVFGVTPYAAYKINDFIFLSALTGYNYTYIKNYSARNDTDVHDFTVEGNVNFYHTFLDSIIVKGRGGSRYRHTYVSSTNSRQDATSDEFMLIADLELGYRFVNGAIIFVGSNYEYFDREQSANSVKEHDGIAYMRGGFDYPINESLSIGAQVQADLNDEDTDIITGSINFRLRL